VIVILQVGMIKVGMVGEGRASSSAYLARLCSRYTINWLDDPFNYLRN